MSVTRDDYEVYVGAQAPNPAALMPGTLVYLWPPGERPYEVPCKPVLGKVERGTVHTIVAKDLGSKARGSYEVGDAHAPGRRWTWEIAAAPEGAYLEDGVLFLDRQHLSREERRQWLLGDVGAMLTFRLQGNVQVSGIVTEIVYDDDRPMWLLVEPPADGTTLKTFRTRIPYDKIVDITEVTSG